MKRVGWSPKKAAERDPADEQQQRRLKTAAWIGAIVVHVLLIAGLVFSVR